MRASKRLRLHRRTLVLAGALVASLALAGGLAYATIPDSNKVFTACMLNKIGTIRLIDPSLGSSSLMGHCTQYETQISWNQQGQPGLPGPQGPQGATGPQGPAGKDGANGTNGTNGKDGVSPTVAQLAAGDSHCPTGGAAITDAQNNTAYVCNGLNGKDGLNGQPFSGTFTSPNGNYSIGVTDNGITLISPVGSVTLDAGGTKIHSDSTLALTSASGLALTGALITLNEANRGCTPAARTGDPVSGQVAIGAPGSWMPLTNGTIGPGSLTVCIG